jgi:hypothetical protein
VKKFLSKLLCLLAFTSLYTHASGQGFEAPADSNAVVYFVRVTNYARNASFDFFHENKLIGAFRGANYMRYECPAGENLFWASSENKQFLKCDLKAGETYLVLINIVMGFWKSNLTLEPVTIANRDFNRVMTFIHDNEGLKMSQERLNQIQSKLNKRDFISHNLKKYESKWIDSHLTKTITPEMSVPQSYLE